MTAFESDQPLASSAASASEVLPPLHYAGFRPLVNQAAVGLVHIDRWGRILYANPRFCQLLGYICRGLRIAHMIEAATPEQMKHLLEPWHAGQSVVTAVIRLVGTTSQPVQVIASALIREGQADGAMWVVYPNGAPHVAQVSDSSVEDYALESAKSSSLDVPASSTSSDPSADPLPEGLPSVALPVLPGSRNRLEVCQSHSAHGRNVALKETEIYDQLVLLLVAQLHSCDGGWSLPDETCPVDWLAQLQANQVIQGCEYSPNVRAEADRYCFLVYPLVYHRELLGLVWLTRPADQGFTDPDLQRGGQLVQLSLRWIHHIRLYQTVQAKVTSLQEANRAKDDFVSTVSHELRNPLSNIRMALRLMAVTSSPEKQQEYYHLALRECERQIELIGDLLDIQRLTVHHFEAKRVPIYLHEWLSEVTAPFYPAFQEKQQLFTLITELSLPIIYSDPTCLSRILTELLSNANKYTAPNGSIDLTLQMDEDTLEMIVANTGSIDIANIDQVFERFYRIPNSDRWKHGGTGLGLTLVRQLVLALQGEIHVKSEENWVVFTLRIPKVY